jgi:hypothetical protein
MTKSKSPKNAKNGNEAVNPKLDNLVQDIIYDLNNLLRNFMEEKDINESMTGKDRMRLIGAGVRNYGFIEKSYDIAREKPQVTKGVRKVVDEISRGQAVVKETVEADVQEVSPLTQPKQ